MSLTATNSISRLSLWAALKTFRPIRPNPLIPTRVDMQTASDSVRSAPWARRALPNPGQPLHRRDIEPRPSRRAAGLSLRHPAPDRRGRSGRPSPFARRQRRRWRTLTVLHSQPVDRLLSAWHRFLLHRLAATLGDLHQPAQPVVDGRLG